MKRILQIVGTMDRAGAETMVMSLYRAIDKTEYQFDFVYFTERPCDYDDEILELGGKIYRIPESLASSSIRRTFELYKIIKNNKPFHAVHCHQLFSNAFHLIAAFCAGSKQRIAHSHNTSDVNSKTLHGKLYQKFSRKIINLLSTDFIACGDEAGKFLFPNQQNVVFIPNAVNVQKFINAKPNDTAQHFFKIEGISEKTMVLSQIGRLMPVKNVEFSINFAEYLKLKKIDFHICLVGAGRLENDLKQLVQSKGLEKQISFLGVRSDIEKVLAHSDALLMPSFHEGFPVILVESQTAGIPALISNRISSEVDLNMGLIEFCALESSFDDWYKKLIELTSKPKMDAKARHDILKDKGFDIEVSVKLLEKIYQQHP
ncbi:glycosyltransferase [Tamlana crocina]|uniref:Glycosyltransferase family 1 protein n=1 Tax=Tamlana crocina TaxID=393006 RepID=A0ABX1D9W6_9FLAO|nr:glycosyltransferase [Tamlana crocina]NJX15160.1 glycosyltransferase family 1 protein [Tamlana crocina]